MRVGSSSIQAGLLLLLSSSFPALAHAVDLEWAAVGDPGNPCDAETDGCYGSVPYLYEIGRFEVTNLQYTAFLNAVADDDPGALYDARMGSDASFGGITRTGSEGSYAYAARPGFADRPVVFVTFWDAVRFANWLHNGQPEGAQGPATTEDGAYTLSPLGIEENTVVANPGATHFLPSENEWHKAAYYALGLGFYWEYPTQASVATACVLPALDDGNAANCWPATSPDGALTDVGSYAASPSAVGSYDQGGNVREWNETISFTLSRVVRGGSWFTSAGAFAATNREARDPASADDDLGFRVARVPEPAAGLAGLAAAAVLAALRRAARDRG